LEKLLQGINFWKINFNAKHNIKNRDSLSIRAVARHRFGFENHLPQVFKNQRNNQYSCGF